jgi:hypothetical protein
MPTLILDSVNYKFRRMLALSKLGLGWAGIRNSVALFELIGDDKTISELGNRRDRGYLLDMSNHQQIRY